MRQYRIRLGTALLLAGFVLVTGCVKPVREDIGFLEGVISIGPLCPVEQIPPQPPCLPTAETYKAYPVGIWTHNGSRLITLIYPHPDGSYKTELFPGSYMVKLVNQQKPGGSNLPVLVTVRPMDYTVLNIDIDTGIR